MGRKPVTMVLLWPYPSTLFFSPSLSFYEEYFPQPIPSNHPKWHVWKKRTRQEDIRACKHHEHYLNPTRRGKERP